MKIWQNMKVIKRDLRLTEFYVTVYFLFITHIDYDYWMAIGEEEIAKSLEDSIPNEKVAKNVIIFIGDGLSLPTVTASRWYKEQVVNNNYWNPESGSLTFEKFPHLGLSKVSLRIVYS